MSRLVKILILSILIFNFSNPIYCCGTSNSKTLKEIYTSQIGVREATGKNDGEDVEKYLKSVNLGKGYAWCAAFVHWCLEQASIKNTVTAWSPSAFNSKNVVYANGTWKKDLKEGDVFTIYYLRLKRIGHTGFVDGRDGKYIITVEGNTNDELSREGDGVYRKRRPLSTIYNISRWE